MIQRKNYYFRGPKKKLFKTCVAKRNNELIQHYLKENHFLSHKKNTLQKNENK